ncbi:MerR family transcriptional regulator [Bacillus sp. C1]
MILNKKTWKVGELAKQTRLTVRMLHHYDKIGLFSPSQSSDKGHRIYTETDIAKLQQIMSLKQLGLVVKNYTYVTLTYWLRPFISFFFCLFFEEIIFFFWSC